MKCLIWSQLEHIKDMFILLNITNLFSEVVRTSKNPNLLVDTNFKYIIGELSRSWEQQILSCSALCNLNLISCRYFSCRRIKVFHSCWILFFSESCSNIWKSNFGSPFCCYCHTLLKSKLCNHILARYVLKLKFGSSDVEPSTPLWKQNNSNLFCSMKNC